MTDKGARRRRPLRIDSHVHILPPSRTRGLVRWVKKAMPGHPSSEDITPEEVLADLRECGVEKVFNFVFPLKEEETQALNEFNRDLAGEFDEVVPFGSVRADTPEMDRVAERCIEEYGLAGIKLHPYIQGFEAFSPAFTPLYRKLDEMGRPLVVHTGFDVFYRQNQDLDYMRRMLDDFPGMPVVLVHSLFPRFGLARGLMGRRENLYVDMTNVISAVRYYRDATTGNSSFGRGLQSAGSETESRAIDTGGWPESSVEMLELVENIDDFYALIVESHDRIMFGTDHPAGMNSPKRIFEDFESFCFSKAITDDLLGGTASRFLEKHCGMKL